MFRIAFRFVCLLSLLVCGATVVATFHTSRAWHNLVWRTDPAAESDGAHASLGSIWRDFRACGRAPGMRPGGPIRFNDAPQRGPGGFETWAVTREYASLLVEDGRVEYGWHSQTLAPFS